MASSISGAAACGGPPAAQSLRAQQQRRRPARAPRRPRLACSPPASPAPWEGLAPHARCRCLAAAAQPGAAAGAELPRQQQHPQQQQHGQRKGRQPPRQGGGQQHAAPAGGADGPGRPSVRRAVSQASQWDDLVAPASDLPAMSGAAALGALLVRALQLAPERRSGREGGAYRSFVAHLLDLAARIMTKAQRGGRGGGSGSSSSSSSTSSRGDDVGSSGAGSSGAGSSGTDSSGATAGSAEAGDAEGAATGGRGGSGSGFAPWQVTTILWHLADAGIAPGPRWTGALWSSTRAQLDAGEWGAQELSKAAFAMARLRLGAAPPAAWRAAFLGAWARHWREASPRQLSSLLWAVATLGWRVPRGWAADASAAAVGALPRCPPRDAAHLLWGLATLTQRAGGGDGPAGEAGPGPGPGPGGGGPGGADAGGRAAPPDPSAPHGARRAARPSAPFEATVNACLDAALPSMAPRQLALVGDALSRLWPGSGAGPGGAASSLPALLAAAEASFDAFGFDKLADLLAALARLDAAAAVPPAWQDAAAARLQARAAECSGPGLATAVWALGTLGWQRQERLAARLLWRSEQLLSEMTPRDLSTLAVGIARLQHRPPRVWLSAFLAASEARLDVAAPQALANTAWAVARIGVQPPGLEPWLDRLCAAAARGEALGGFKPSEMAQLLYALGAWRHAPRDAAVWAALQARLRELLPATAARGVVMVAAAAGQLRARRAERDGGGSGSGSDGGGGGGGGGDGNGGGDGGGREDGPDADAAAHALEPATLDALLCRARRLLAAGAGGSGPAAPGQAGPGRRGARGAGQGAERLAAADLGTLGKGLALAGARPGPEWLADWRAAVEAADASLDAERARSAVEWATAVLEGRASVDGGDGPGGWGGGE
ncbi:hypothetical protein Rsub_10556 [Raphidocelis subcapitata]|uniref:Tbc2 translation factor, chloroplastic n=1 Tax=Raphidocelis subcapitata TaxID=307507 RepID=A0A2V0PE68_9CHLO|nr:hypothetical protein Rsub_10556 [Raphidocelis subcapitata]|eukprot:GBF98144.1 hypothetical protein Rsub_10556 [Raphidocelis subcapitata]